MSIVGTSRRNALALVASVAGLIGIRSATTSAAMAPAPRGADARERPLSQTIAQDVTRTPYGYGARGDTLGDDGPALRQAVASCGPAGGAVDLPPGHYKSGGTAGGVILIDAPVALTGKGPSLSVINPDLASDADDTIVVSPDVHFSHDGLVLRGFGLLDPTNGERRGRRGIFLKTDGAGQQLAGMWLENLSIGAGTGTDAWGVHHRNGQGPRATPNPNGGWYGGGIRRCLIKGGIFLEKSGDSLHVDDNILSGAGRSLTVALVPGASCLTVRANNMTSRGGAIKHLSGHRCAYVDNNIEHNTVGIATDGDGHRAVVDFTGDGVPGVANRLVGGLVSAFGKSDANILVKIKNQRGFLIDGVTILQDVDKIATIYIAPSSRDTIVGRLIVQDINGDGAADISIVDDGIGTMGITKIAALRNGWVAGGAKDEALRYRKSSEGRVYLWGSIAAGTGAKDAVITVLPPGFRPSRPCRSPFMVVDENTGTVTTGHIVISPQGAVTMTPFAGDAGRLTVDVAFEALNAGTVLTAE